jgi:hypothetical protein
MEFQKKKYTFRGLDGDAGFRHGQDYELELGTSEADDASGNYATITGNLTIKGKTNPLSFPAKVGVKSGIAAASATATADRTKYDIKFRSKSFFESLGDKAIDDTFTLTFNVIAKADGVAAR